MIRSEKKKKKQSFWTHLSLHFMFCFVAKTFLEQVPLTIRTACCVQSTSVVAMPAVHVLSLPDEEPPGIASSARSSFRVNLPPPGGGEAEGPAPPPPAELEAELSKLSPFLQIFKQMEAPLS